MQALVGECSELYYRCTTNKWVLMRCDTGIFDGTAAECKRPSEIARCRELYGCSDEEGDEAVYPVLRSKENGDGADAFDLLNNVPAEPQALLVPEICVSGERFALSACSSEYRECFDNAFVERICFDDDNDVFNPRTLECDRFNAIFGIACSVYLLNNGDCRVPAGVNNTDTGADLQ